MRREADPKKKLKVTLKVGGKKQLFEITGFYGELEALQEAVNFLEKLGASKGEIKRMLSEGAKRADLCQFKNKQQALDQLVWLAIIQGKMDEMRKRVLFLKDRDANHDFLKQVIIMALRISSKIYKTSDSEKIIAAKASLIVDRIYPAPFPKTS